MYYYKKKGKDIIKYEVIIDIEIKKNNILLSVIPKKHFLRRFSVKKRLKYLYKKRILS